MTKASFWKGQSVGSKLPGANTHRPGILPRHTPTPLSPPNAKAHSNLSKAGKHPLTSSTTSNLPSEKGGGKDRVGKSPRPKSSHEDFVESDFFPRHETTWDRDSIEPEHSKRSESRFSVSSTPLTINSLSTSANRELEKQVSRGTVEETGRIEPKTTTADETKRGGAEFPTPNFNSPTSLSPPSLPSRRNLGSSSVSTERRGTGISLTRTSGSR